MRQSDALPVVAGGQIGVARDARFHGGVAPRTSAAARLAEVPDMIHDPHPQRAAAVVAADDVLAPGLVGHPAQDEQAAIAGEVLNPPVVRRDGTHLDEPTRIFGGQLVEGAVNILGASHAIVTSANLTGNALDSNIEVGVEVSEGQARELGKWFDQLWQIASPLTVPQLAELQSKTAALPRDYIRLKRRCKGKLSAAKVHKAGGKLTDSLQLLFSNAPRYFVCHTDRRQGERTPTGGYVLEQEMFNRGPHGRRSNSRTIWSKWNPAMRC